jgi:hypothetical protein
MAELFGPYSPVWRSPTTSIVPSLVDACMRADALVHEDTCAITADSITGENTIEHAIVVPSLEDHCLDNRADAATGRHSH